MSLIPEMLVAATGCKPTTAEVAAPALAQAMALHEIDAPLRMAHFLAQCAHESELFQRTVESLNYEAEVLVTLWPNRFYLPPAEPKGRENALEFGRTAEHEAQQIKIALIVYSGRMGNGPPETVDGWKFRGRGYLQLTGRDAYTRFNAAEPSVLCVTYPELLQDPDGAAKSAAWFWQTRGCNTAADFDSVAAVTKIINGGMTGLQDRVELTQRARAAIGD